MKRPSRQELLRLRVEKRLSDEDIALHYKIAKRTARRWVRVLEIPDLVERQGFAGGREKYASPDGSTSLEHAIVVLGGRIMERLGYGYYLDGKPVSVTEVLDEANRVLHL